MQTPVRFSSCRGVAFEIKPHADPFAINPTPPQNKPSNNTSRFWFPWYQGNSSKVLPSSIQRSLSRPSSHFCDLDLDDDEEEENEQDIILERLEEGKDYEEDEKPRLLPSAVSKRSGQPPKPARKPESRLSIILLDQGLFTVYKRLFAVCLTLNITGLVLAATGHFPYARNRAVLFSIGNILALTLCRSEAFLRVVFWLAVKVLGRSWVPLQMKTATTALLQSLGGIHSSCGISSIAWLIYALPCRASVCLLWVAKEIKQNFGKEIEEMVSRHPKDKVIVHDTALFGRPNVSEMSVEAAKKWEAEVVIVTSNPEGSRDVVNACKASGIPAFGPIWDS
ncbi:hypothetical protein SLEP1_g44912 [Rubroshorea leprosula]|uniref:Uncharacterized protein n=1 Tax=Rubroshorea leprosula TaxID=152421 RepID=A0AAV5LJ17_9ROSI|nr:hypothetical protein SLEP1_g44912 [Rubroshorea leprosula]